MDLTPNLTFAPDRAVQARPSATVSFAHLLTNVSADPITVTFGVVGAVGDDFDLDLLRLVLDSNGDGLISAGEPVVAFGSPLPLQAGEAVDLLLLGAVPSDALVGTTAGLTLTAAPSVGLDASVQDTVVVIRGADVQISKRTSAQNATPGSVVTFFLTALGVGDSIVEATPINIDGNNDQRVIVRDAMPRNSTFEAVVAVDIATPLYHRYGDALHDYSTTPPAAAEIDAVAFAYPPQPANFNSEVGFSVRINDNASDAIDNVATSYFRDAGLDQQSPSNSVTVVLPAIEPIFNYYDPNLLEIVAVSGAGRDLQLQANASACNVDAQVVERYAVDLTTQSSGDTETNFELVETTPNSGIFQLTQVVTARWPQTAQVANNGVLEVGRNDIVSAVVQGCAGVALSAQILIDPAGVVFDSRTNQPIADASVTLIGINADGSEFVPTVLNFDGSAAPNQVITGADGLFEFPLVPAGNYRLEILAPSGFRFPSTVAASELDPGRRIDVQGSYGGSFPVDAATGAVFLDVPLDPASLSGLFIEKNAVDASVALGESVRYTIRVINETNADLADVVVRDTMPQGFKYVADTTWLDKLKQDEPAGVPGPELQFAIGTLAAGEDRLLSYRLRAGIGALRGKGVNTAQAVSPGAISNISLARVDVRGGVFADDGFVLGKVFVDCDNNRVQDPEELGIPGVRLYLEDGTYAISDAEGKYSFSGLPAQTHVLRLDRESLPQSAELTTLSNRNGGDPASRFIDLKRGELHRADFAEGSCNQELVNEVKERRIAGSLFETELEQRLLAHTRTANVSQTFDPRSRPAAGILEADGRINEYQPTQKIQKPELSKKIEVRKTDLKATIQAQSNDLGFVDLTDGDIVASQQLDVSVKGVAGTRFVLQVNDETVAATRVGEKATLASRQIQAWRFVAVELQPGNNRLSAKQVDNFGNVRGRVELTVTAPDDLGRIRISIPPGGAIADSETPVPVIVELQDEHDVPVTSRTAVTLHATRGHWDADDLDPLTPGLQTFIEGGDALFDLLPPGDPGAVSVRVTSGQFEATRAFDFLPHLRPLLVSGVIEGAVGFSRLDKDQLSPAAQEDGFEEQVGNFNFAGADGKAGARTAVFLKGKVRGDYLLTLAYDSDKDLRDRLFRDIRPDEFYAVYGDSSIKGFDAQSTGKLYVRVDKGRSFLLYGDYTTQSEGESRQLGNYSRSLNGGRYHFENDFVTTNVFAAYDDNRQVVIELPGQGISGPYPINDQRLVVNSENIEIITRDRDQPAIVIDARPVTRFVDYSLDFVSGSVLFKAPVPSVDADLNPISIRITYESDANVDRYWVYGFDGQLTLGDHLEIGGSFVNDRAPGAEYELYSANATVKINDKSSIVAELARSDSELDGTGDAARVEMRHESARVSARVYGYRSDEEFVNPNASINAGRNEAGAKTHVRLRDDLQLNGELLYTEDQASGGIRKGALASIEKAFANNLRLETGIRHSTQTLDATTDTEALDEDTTSARVRLDWQPAFLSESSLFGEYEQDLENPDAKLAAVGGEYQIGNLGRAYLRHELISSLSGGAFGLSEFADRNHNTVFGVDVNYLEDANLFSEYRVRDAVSGREAEAAIGLRNTWDLGGPLKLLTTFELVQPMDGDGDETTAATIGLEYNTERLKGTTRLEVRRSDETQSMLSTIGLARKINRNWSLLGQNTLTVNENRDTDSKVYDDRLRLGLAYRDTDINKLSALGCDV